MKYIKSINEIWGPVLKRDLLGETREEDKFHNKKDLIEYLKSEIEKQGENVVIRNLDVSLVEDLSWLFHKIADNVKTLDLSGWNTSNVKNMGWMFGGCSILESLDVTGWNTSNVKDMYDMFYICERLKSLDLSSWDVSNVKNMSGMFHYCSRLKSLDLSSWDVSGVDTMEGMFYYCSNLKSLDLSGWDTSKVEDMTRMFYNCPAPYEVVKNKIVKK